MSLTDSEKQKFAAALERLEEERQRRIAAKVEAGEAVVVPLGIVGDQRPEDVRAARLAQLRQSGERREIIFDETYIETGVPRHPTHYERALAPAQSTSPTKTAERQPAGSALRLPESNELYAKHAPQPRPPPDTSERRYVRTEINPTSERDCGAIMEGTFTADGGTVRVYDLKGSLLGTQPVRPGDYVMTVAKRLLRKGAAPSFYAPIRYPPPSVH